MTDKNDWQGRVGASWADEYERTDRSFSVLTDRLLGLASSGGFSRALDIGCGAGELSLALGRGHPSAVIRGIDISERLIEAARRRGSRRGNVGFEIADAARWKPVTLDAAPDLLVSRHGVMFFEDPAGAFSHLRSIAAPSARFVFSCFRNRDENNWATEVSSLLPGSPAASPDGPWPFALANREKTAGLLEQAGWEDVRLEPFDFPYIAGGGDNPVEDAVSYFLSIGPAARAAADLTPEARAGFTDDLRHLLGKHRDGGLVMLKAAAWLVSATAPERP